MIIHATPDRFEKGYFYEFMNFNTIADISLQAYRKYQNRLTVENWQKMQLNLANTEAMASRAQFYVADYI